MAQLHDIYKLVSTANKIATKLEKQSPGTTIINGHYIHVKPSIFSVKEKYTKPHKWLPARSVRKVHDTTAFALEKGYLENAFEQEDDIRHPIFKITLKGQDLLERSLFRTLPKGLMLAWVDKNKDFYSLLI